MRTITRIAPDVGWPPISFVNVYFIDGRGRVGLVDAGLPGRANQILEAAEARFGAGARPEAIFSRTDIGTMPVRPLAEVDAVYAHRLEIPYLGKSDYPPPDPTVGGAMAFSPASAIARARFRERVRELHPMSAGWLDGAVCDARAFSGHISFFRLWIASLLAGDVTTMNMDSRVAWSPANERFRARERHSTRLMQRGCPSGESPAVAAWHVVGWETVALATELPEQLERFAERSRAPRGVAFADPSRM
jgi:hypothetical protein